MPSGYDQEELVLNKRTTLRVKRPRPSLVDLTAESKIEILERLIHDPERFLKSDFLTIVKKLKEYTDELLLQESAIVKEVRSFGSESQLRWLIEGTQSRCEQILNDFESLLSPFVSGSTTGLKLDKLMPWGGKLTTISEPYKRLFGDSGWFEVVCYSIIKNELKEVADIRISLGMEVLGRSTIWHEMDVLLVMEDVSICFEAKSGRWGRKDILKLLAQREDIGCDLGILLSLEEPSEDFDQITVAHPIRNFTLSEGKHELFKDWLREKLLCS